MNQCFLKGDVIMIKHGIFGDHLFEDKVSLETPMDIEFFGKENPWYDRQAKRIMRTDVRETEEGYEVDIDLPGFQKEEIQLHLENGYLSIFGAKSREEEEKDKKGIYLRRERYTGVMKRNFYVGDALQPEDIQAKYEAGVLTLSFPKKQLKETNKKSKIFIKD